MKRLLEIADVGSGRVDSGKEKCVTGTQGMISYPKNVNYMPCGGSACVYCITLTAFVSSRPIMHLV